MRLLLSVLLTFSFLSSSGQEHYMIVGTYDSPKSEGIYVFRFNSADGSAKEISHVKTSNPSFLAIAPGERFVYAVNSLSDSTGKGGRVSSFFFNKKEGTLFFINSQSSEGNNPCYISVDKTGKWAVVANYTSGVLTLLGIKENGELEKSKSYAQFYGSGPDTARQKSSHVHAAIFDSANTTLYITDLGSDELNVHGFNASFGMLAPKGRPQLNPGSGPRHMDIHPNGKYLYLLEELSGGISIFLVDSIGRLQGIQHISAVPKDYTGPASSADIHVSADGKFLYCSNRGNSNTIGIFSVNEKNGMLTLIGHQSTLGKTPRNFSIDPSGNFLLCENQNSDEIVIFKRDANTGLLSDTGNRIAVGKPVCIKWVAVD